jgi:nucleoside-diphosphate-sugar epimerase
MNILITGASGFIGSIVAQSLGFNEANFLNALIASSDTLSMELMSS